ncbi:molybdopterin oxidoreductase family protein [Nitratifractor salsuginis]|uniref:Molybdopterin oxidoreductase n=1 Tax=Nitratifractor salsuginis (strain DSM 16511 / JCM 12458 / E9I37-1) TaxID=749222 RepID=E6X1J5_NITSE|nr:molybdopterin-dependent oxidoreductase [Nitratifractor salsuginis]ADV45928.1 molybdopterin oxidoreductase [Nitratifractor salsuginis DSM 16511]
MNREVERQEVESVCTYCGVGCDITGVVENNRIVKVYAQKDGVVSQGKLCIKGKYGFDFVEAADRVRIPRVRRSFLERNPELAERYAERLKPLDETWMETDLETATDIAAAKLAQIRERYGPKSFCAIGGARTSCESAYAFQKFCRETMGSPHVDNCARVCHSPSLKGMRATIGEGAATNPYNDIYETEFIIVIGSNTIEAHPIVANRIVDVARTQNNLAVIDVRRTKLSKLAKHDCIIPFEANLMVLNMMARVIIEEELYDEEFIAKRTKNFEEYKEKILNDPYADPAFFKQVEGYEYLAKMIPNIAREYALKRSMIFWGLGITEHIDGSYAVMALTHLALLTGNIGKSGAGLMPLRGQNNVQGACDMGCLPYYAPDYRPPREVGLMTPQLIDAMQRGEIKALLNMGEDLAHIHPNLNKIDRALEQLDFLMVQELFMTEIAQRADIVVGVKSAYEKTGVYVNAMRRLHLSQPLVQSDLPDDWEVLTLMAKKLGDGANFDFASSEDVWNEVRREAPERFSGAAYYRLERHRKRGMQWPIYHEDTPILHLLDFRTEDGLGRFVYRQWQKRGMVEEILEGRFYRDSLEGYYLTTGRTLAHYNNAAQTKRSQRLKSRYDEDILLANSEDEERFGERVILRSEHGESEALKVAYSDAIRPRTLFCTFHHAKSRINTLFGDESDELILTARFKSVKVEVIPVGEAWAGS